MNNYKSNPSANRKKMLMQIYGDGENRETDFQNFFCQSEFSDFNTYALNESFEILLGDSKNLQNKALDQIIQLTKLSHEKVLTSLNPKILGNIIELTFREDTCEKAFSVLAHFTYFTDVFNIFIYNSNLFEFMSANINEFNREELMYCIYLLINLFISIPLEKPLQVKLIKNLLLLELHKINQITIIVDLFSIIIEKDDLPVKYFSRFFSILKKILFQSDEFAKAKNKVLKEINSLLENEKYSKSAANLINSNNLIGPILKYMNDNNLILCFTIIRKMISIDDTFFPQLTAYQFNQKLFQFCQYEKEEVQYHALLFSAFYVQNFPDLAKEFLNYQFEAIFLRSSFKIKAKLVCLYIYVIPVFIERKYDFKLQLSSSFIDELLEMVNDDNDYLKMCVYDFLTLALQYQNTFIFSFNVVGVCLTNQIMWTAKDDSLSENQELAEKASSFIHIVNELMKKNEKPPE